MDSDASSSSEEEEDPKDKDNGKIENKNIEKMERHKAVVLPCHLNR